MVGGAGAAGSAGTFGAAGDTGGAGTSPSVSRSMRAGGGAVATGRAATGVGSSADFPAGDRTVVAAGNGCGANFAGGVFGSNGGGSVGVLTWSRIVDDSSGIEDDSPGLGVMSNAEIVDVVGFGGGSANAREWVPSPILGPSTIPAMNPLRIVPLIIVRLRARVPFDCFSRAEPAEDELTSMRFSIGDVSNLGVNAGHA